MNPDSPSDGWNYIDIAAMLNADPAENAGREPEYIVPAVELSSGFHPGEDEYVIDPDYFEMLGLTDPAELVKRKDSISR